MGCMACMAHMNLHNTLMKIMHGSYDIITTQSWFDIIDQHHLFIVLIRLIHNSVSAQYGTHN